MQLCSARDTSEWIKSARRIEKIWRKRMPIGDAWQEISIFVQYKISLENNGNAQMYTIEKQLIDSSMFR